MPIRLKPPLPIVKDYYSIERFRDDFRNALEERVKAYAAQEAQEQVTTGKLGNHPFKDFLPLARDAIDLDRSTNEIILKNNHLSSNINNVVKQVYLECELKASKKIFGAFVKNTNETILNLQAELLAKGCTTEQVKLVVSPLKEGIEALGTEVNKKNLNDFYEVKKNIIKLNRHFMAFDELSNSRNPAVDKMLDYSITDIISRAFSKIKAFFLASLPGSNKESVDLNARLGWNRDEFKNAFTAFKRDLKDLKTGVEQQEQRNDDPPAPR